MINVNSFKNYCETLANKDQTGAGFTATQFNSVLPEEVIDLIEQYFGKAKDARKLLLNEKNQVIKDYISNSQVNVRTSINVTNGFFNLPANYLHLNSLHYEYYETEEVVCTSCGCVSCNCKKLPKGFKVGKKGACADDVKSVKKLAEVVMIGSGQWSELLSDAVSYPTEKYPYGKYVGNNEVEIAPTTIPKLHLQYYRYPAEAFWASTPLNGQALYDPANSVNIELPRVLLRELSCGVLAKMGLHTREYWVEQTSKQAAITGV